MAYDVITAYPNTESVDGSNKIIKTSKKEFNQGVTLETVLTMYNEYQRQGFTVNPKFKSPTDDAETSTTPFEIAEALTKNGIDYKATLKVKNAGNYEEAKALAKLIEQHGYDFNAGVTFKINEASPINFDHVETWTQDADKNAVYKITPKASAKDVNELKGVYDALLKANYEAAIDVKPKNQSTDDEAADFSNQLSVYPDGTEITFTLKDGE